MPASILAFFDRFFDVKPREFFRVHAFFFFLATASVFYTMGASVGDTLFLSRFGSRAAEHLLPWVYIGMGLVTIAATWAYENVEERVDRERFVVGVNLVLAFSVLLFRWALRSRQLWLYYALEIWLETCALTVLMLFFSFAGDYFTSRDARRLYGYINGGIALGSIAGGFAVDRLAAKIGDDNLLYVCAGLLALCAGWCIVIPSVAKRVSNEEKEEGEGDSKAPLKAVLSNRYLQVIIALVLVSQAYGWLVDYQLKVAASRRLQEEALAAFFGKFYGTLGFAQLLVQFGLVGWLLRRFGVTKSLLILPLCLLASSGAFYLHPAFSMAVVANFLRFTFLETLDEPTQELLFVPLSPRLRVRAQSFIEGMVLPLGISLSGLLLWTLSVFVSDLRLIALIGISFGIVWLILVFALSRRYREMLASSLKRFDLDSRDLSTMLGKAEGIHALRELLKDKDADLQRLALEILGDRPSEDIARAVGDLVESADEPLASKALEVLARGKCLEQLPAVLRAAGDRRPGVRAAAVSAYFEIDPDSAAMQLARWFQDPEPGVQVALLTGCLSFGGRLANDMALARIEDMLKSGDLAKRIDAAKILGRAARFGATGLFKQLRLDPDPAVRREVVAACMAVPEAEMVPWLVEQLRETDLRPLAAQALEEMPLSAVPAFIECIADGSLSIEDRSFLTRILGRFGGLRAGKVLWEIIQSDENVLLRAAAAETLYRQKDKDKTRAWSHYQEGDFWDRRLQEIRLIHQAREEVGQGDSFFSQALLDHARLEIRTALFGLGAGIEERQDPVGSIEATLFGGTEGQAANALEMIEVVFPHHQGSRLAGAIAPLLSELARGQGELRPETARRLLQSQSWLRAVTRHHLDHKGIRMDGGKMSGQEIYMVKLMAHVSLLKKARLFEHVTANYLMSLAKIVEERTFCNGEILFSEGDKGDCCYLIYEGTIRILSGKREVARLTPGECVGETALIDNFPRSATAIAEGDLRVLRISYKDFNDVLLTHPEISVALLRYLGARLRESQALNAAGSR